MDPNDIETLVQRLVANPHDEEALAYAHQAGAADPRGYAALLERIGNETQDPAYASHWLSEAANVWLTTLGDAHRAARVLMAAIDRDPTQQVAAERLAQLYRDKGDAKALAALLERRAKALFPLIGAQPELRGDVAGMYEEVGRLWTEAPLAQQAGAIDPKKKALDNFRRAIELDPTSQYAIFHARELMKQQSLWDDAYQLYDMELGLEQEGERKVALLRDEAATRRLAGDLQGVTRTLARARQVDEQDPGLQQEFAASILDRMQAGEPVPPGERTLASELLVQLAESYDGEHGLAYAGAALDIAPGHDRAMQLYVYYARTLQRDQELPPRFAAYVEANPNGTMATEGRQALAASYELADEIDKALEVLEPLRAKGDATAESRIEELRARAKARGPVSAKPVTGSNPSAQSLSLASVSSSASGSGTDPTSGPRSSGAHDMEPPAKRTSVLPPDKLQGILDAAQMLAGKGKKVEAFAKYKEILDSDPAQPEALAWVEDYLRTKRDYTQLKDVLLASVRVMASLSEGMEGRKERLREVAGLCEGQLRDIDGAIGAWKQLLAIDRADDSARQSLTRLLERTQRWDDLANLFEQEATIASEVDTKIALERKLASLNENKRKDFGAAAEAWGRIARLAPEDDRAILTSSRLFEKAGNLVQAAAVIADNAAQLEDPVARGSLFERLGELREQLSDISGAGTAYAEAADAQKSARHWDNAERCFIAAEKWSEAANAATQRAQLTGDPKQQAAHLGRAADLLVRIGDEAGALARLEQASELDPTADDYAIAVANRYEASERWLDLVELLVRRGDRLADRAKRVAIRRQTAVLYAQQINDRDAAREQWLKVLEDGDDREALEKLIDYAVERDDHTEAATLLRRLGGIAVDKADKARVALREAELLAEGVGDIDTAIVRYETILSDLDPTCRPALQAIADLQEARDNPAAAADALERELKLVADGQERGQIAARLARLYEQLDDPRAAIRALDLVRKADLEDFDALTRLCELCERVEQWDRVAELLAERIEIEGDEVEAAALTLKLTMVLADKLDRGDEALAALTELADQGDPNVRQAYVELGDRLGWKGIVASKLVDWWFDAKNGPERTAALKGAFERFAAVGRDQDAARVAIEIVRARAGDHDLAVRLEELAVKTSDHDALSVAHDLLARDLVGSARAAEVVRQAEAMVRAGMPRDEAIQHGESALANVPGIEAEPLLDRLAELTDKPHEVVELYERQVSRSRAPLDRVRALARAAQVSAARGHMERTRSLFELALTGTPTDDILELLESYAADGDRSTGGERLRRVLCTAYGSGGGGARDGGKTRSGLLRRAANIAQRDLHDIEQAFVWLGDALIAHVDGETLDVIESTALELGEPRRAEQALTRALSEVFDGPLVRQLLARRAKLRREQLGDRTGAAADLKKLHDLSPQDHAVLEQLSSMLRELGDFRGMVQLYEDQILRGRDMGARAELARKVARMWEEQLQDPREAADAWRRVLRMRPSDPEATDGLERAKNNTLKRPDPNAGPDAYAPPPPTYVSLTPPGSGQIPAPPAPSSGRPLVGPPPKSVVPAPTGPFSRLPTSEVPSLADDAPKTVGGAELEMESTSDTADSTPPGSVTKTVAAVEVPEEAHPPRTRPSAEPKPAGSSEESTQPHALSMELIAAIRGTGKGKGKASVPPPAMAAPMPGAMPTPFAAPMPGSKAAPMPSPSGMPAPLPADVAPKTESVAPKKAPQKPRPLAVPDEREDMMTSPGGPGFTRGAARSSVDTPLETSMNTPLETPVDVHVEDDPVPPAAEPAAFGSFHDTQAGAAIPAEELSASDLQLSPDSSDEVLVVDDLAEIVEESSDEEKPQKPKSTIPPPIPRS